jgi:hypothetical protein
MRFFLDAGEPRWLFRGTDDTVVNFDLLEEFFQDLEVQRDPLKEVVVLGDCVRHEDWLYPQGGSGYLLSRAAVQLIEPLRDEWVNRWGGPEDMSFGSFLESLKIPMKGVSSAAFMGHAFSREVLFKLRERNWEGFPTCPKLDLLPTEPCGQVLARVRDVVFFHEYEGNWPGTIENARGIFEAPPGLYYYRGPNACRTRNKTMLRMYPGWRKYQR